MQACVLLAWLLNRLWERERVVRELPLVLHCLSRLFCRAAAAGSCCLIYRLPQPKCRSTALAPWRVPNLFLLSFNYALWRGTRDGESVADRSTAPCIKTAARRLYTAAASAAASAAAPCSLFIYILTNWMDCAVLYKYATRKRRRERESRKERQCCCQIIPSSSWQTSWYYYKLSQDFNLNILVSKEYI